MKRINQSWPALFQIMATVCVQKLNGVKSTEYQSQRQYLTKIVLYRTSAWESQAAVPRPVWWEWEQ